MSSFGFLFVFGVVVVVFLFLFVLSCSCRDVSPYTPKLTTHPHQYTPKPLPEVLSMYDLPDINGTIPTTLFELLSLEFIYIYDTGIGGSIPTEIGNLDAVSRLYLNDNSLTGSIPTEIGN